MRGIFCLLLVVGTAGADEENRRDAARAHYRAGMASYVMGRYEQAIGEFEAGFAIEPAPAFVFNLAQCHARLGHRQQAVELYRAYLDMHPEHEDLAAVRRMIEELGGEPPAPSVAPSSVAPSSVAPPEPSPSPAPAALASAIVIVAPPPPARKRRVWPIAVGVAAGLVAAGLTIGLAVGLTREQEPSLLLSAR